MAVELMQSMRELMYVAVELTQSMREFIRSLAGKAYLLKVKDGQCKINL